MKTFGRTRKRLLAFTLSVVLVSALGYGFSQTKAYAEDPAGLGISVPASTAATGQEADGASDQGAAQTDPIPGSTDEQDTSSASDVTPVDAGAAASDSLSQQEFTAIVYSDDTLTTLIPDSNIHVSGELPAGGYAVAFPVDPSTVDGDVLCAYDITVYCADGTKFEFDQPLTVSIDVPDLPDDVQADDLGLVYIPADPAQEPESLPTPVAVTDTGVSFDVEHFSTYAVVLTSVNAFALSVDGAASTNPAVGTGTNPNSITANSDYPGQVHTLTISAGAPANTNLRLTGLTQDGASVLSTLPINAPFIESLNFNTNTQIVLTYNNANGTGTTTTRTITFNITVTNNYAPLAIEDSIVQNGLLTAYTNDATSPSVVSYTWYKSTGSATNADGSFVSTAPINSSAVSSDGTSINVAEDGGAQMWYEVAAKLADGSTIYSAPYQVTYYSSIQNGSFENPLGTSLASFVNANNNFANYNNGTPGMVWQTTAQDGQIEIGNGLSAYNLTTTADGLSRWAELNANNTGTLYQDVLVVPGETLSWTLSHSGRYGDDTMNVVIMPTSQVQVGMTSYDATQIQPLVDGSIKVTPITDGKNSWGQYSGDYTVPDGVYVVRFFFVSTAITLNGATSQTLVTSSNYDSTTMSVGNLLDGVTFSSSLSYKIQYYVNGNLQAMSDVYQTDPRSVINADGTITSPGGTDSTNAALAALYATYNGNSSYTLQKTMLTTFDPTTPIDPTTGNALSGGTELTPYTFFTLSKANSVLQLFYVTEGVYVYKKVVGVSAGDMPDNYQATFDLYDNNGVLVSTAKVPLSSSSVPLSDGSYNGSIQFLDSSDNPIALNIPATYTIKERSYGNIPNYTYTTTTSQGVQGVINNNGTTISPGTTDNTVTFTTSSTYQIYEADFTNTYEPNTTLTVSKEVVGEYADTTKPFSFTATFLDSNGDPLTDSFDYEGDIVPGSNATAPAPGTLTLDTNGTTTFTLSHGQLITIENVPPNCRVDISEIPDIPGDYDASYTDSADITGTVTYASSTEHLYMSQDPRVIAFTNTFHDVAATGVDVGNDNSFLLFCVAVLAIGLTLLLRIEGSRRRKKAGGEAL